MSYQALYRVWRPQTFHDVVGQEHITRTLQNALLQDKTSHAYLFSGPRGTGKTSAAKIFAKAINCERAPVAEPCNECETCLGITNGTIDDVLEMDAASNNSVDEIREIREKVKYAPSYAKYKVYIIDEVHMLSIGAFNALLKTLEEPPKHVIFILATTEPHKIPLTIISRCQRYEFHKIRPHHIIGRMEHILNEQQIVADKAALQIVARAAEGGMRDALSILDQAISFSEDEVTSKDVLAVTGVVSQEYLLKLVESIANNEVVVSLEIINQLYELGKDPNRTIDDLLYFYRDILLYQTSPTLEYLFERVIVNEEFINLSNKLTNEYVQRVISALAEAQQQMKWTIHPKILFETAIIKLNDTFSQKQNTANPQLEEKVKMLEQLIQQIQNQPNNIANVANDGVKKAPKQISRTTVKVQTAKIREVLSGATRKHLEFLKMKWADINEELKQKNRAFSALLAHSEIVAASDKGYVLSFKYEILCQKSIENQELISTLHMIHRDIVNKELDVYFVPEANWQQIREDYLSGGNAMGDDSEKETTQAPIIEEALKIFGEDLVEIIE